MYKKYKKGIQYTVYTLIVLMLVLSTLPFPRSVYAATQNRDIQGEGAQVEGTYFGGAADFTNLNSDDADTSFLQFPAPAAWHHHSYDFQDFLQGGTITDVTITAKARITAGAGNYLKLYCRIDGTNYYSTALWLQAHYTTNTMSWVNNPATGTAWTATTLNAAEFGMYGATSDVWTQRSTYVYITVTYTPPTVPTVTTTTTDNITHTGGRCWADFHGEVTDDGGAAVTIRGFAWGTTCNSTTPDSTETPPASYSANWSEYSADHGEGIFSYTTNLTCCTTFCVRSYAMNSAGWAWGAEETFVTMCDPDIDTAAATYISLTTARLNALVIYDGEQACDVRFLYSVLSGNCTDDALGCTTATCNATTYNGTTPWVLDTYTTGQTPYIDISGLATGTTYYFCSQIRNDVSCRCGGELSFTTSTPPPAALATPTNFKGIARSTEISLFWVKAAGYDTTLIRGKTGSYPSSILDGEEVYFDTMTSVVHDGLTPGTTYLYRAWGESGGLYTASNATLMITTLGIAPGGDPMPVPTTPSQFYQPPSGEGLYQIPFFGLVNWWGEVFEIPQNTMWFVAAILMSIAAGIYTFFKSQKVFLSCIVVAVMLGFGSFMGLLSLWLVVPFVIMAFAAIALGERI